MALRNHKEAKTKKEFSLSQKRQKESRQSFVDVNSSIELLDVKAILDTKEEHIALVNYGYLQLLEIAGKDLGSLSYNEITRTLYNFEKWLTDFNTNIQFQVTKLPTNTDSQVRDLRHALAKVKEEKALTELGSRFYYQLEDREGRLLDAIAVEENIQKEIYNTEFILWLFADTTTELDDLVKKAQTYGNNDFVPRPIKRAKKEQILKQYNNMNEKL